MIYVFKVDRSDFSILSKNNFELFKKVLYGFEKNIISVDASVSGSGIENEALSKQEFYVKVTTNSSNEYLKQLSDKEILPLNFYLDTNTNLTYSANQHEDYYLDIKEIGIQGPFTQEHVGGTQHRHQNINKVLDRKEFYNFDGVNFTSRSANEPKSIFLREERAKRPVNIKNIKNTGSVLGNFENNYEVVQTAGRSINNLYFIEVEGSLLTASAASPYITGVLDYELPVRDSNKTVFACLFAAPGGPEVSSRGALDKESEEFSVYNSLNFRNQIVRNYINDLYSNTSSITPGENSYHQVNKNPTRLSGGVIYDNWFVSRQIPSTDGGYGWISASLSGTRSGSTGYILPTQPNVDYSWNFIFLSASVSSSAVIDYVGTNIRVKKSINTSSVLMSSLEGAASLNSYLLNVNGPYGYSSWKQIRGGDNLVNIALKENSIISVQNTASTTDNLADSTTIYYEPYIEYNKPIKITYSSSLEGIQEIVSDYNNEKTFFANKFLKSRLTKSLPAEKETPYDDIKQLTEIYDSNGNPIYQIKKIEFSEIILPKKEDITLLKVRDKPEYSEVAGTGSNGYDRNVSQIRTFWRDSLANRARTNAENSSIILDNIAGSPVYIGGKNVFEYAYLSSMGNTSSVFSTDSNRVISGNLLIPNTNKESTFFQKFNLSEFYNSVNALDTTSSLTIAYGSRLTNTSSTTNLTTSYAIFGDLASYQNYEARELVLYPSGGLYINPVIHTNRMPAGYSYSPDTPYFVYASTYHRIFPRPQFLYNNHIPSFSEYATNANVTTGNKYPIAVSNVFINNVTSYKTDILSNNKPWYDSYDDFFDNIKYISSKYTILPEYKFDKVSDFYIRDNLLNFQALYPNDYLSYDGINSSSLMDIKLTNNFINNLYEDNKNNDLLKNKYLNLKVNGVLKLLPYKGFYPSERALQITNLFYKSAIDLPFTSLVGGSLITAVPKEYRSNQAYLTYGFDYDYALQSLIQPLFSPGILFNTIKASVAVDWPIFNTGYDEYNNAYSRAAPVTAFQQAPAAFQISGSSNKRMPFETILSLNKIFTFIQNGDAEVQEIPYVNPLIYSSDIISARNITGPGEMFFPSYDHRKYKFYEKNYLYTLGINNFLAEIPNFFLQENKLTNFISAPQSKLNQEVIANKEYYMDVVLLRTENQKQIVDTTASYTYISASTSDGLTIDDTIEMYTRSNKIIKLEESSFYGPPVRNFVSNDEYAYTLPDLYEPKTTSEYSLFHMLHPPSLLGGVLPARETPAYDDTEFTEFSPAFHAYAPPYYYGKAYARIRYKPDYSGPVSIRHILANATVQYFHRDGDADLRRDTIDTEWKDNTPSRLSAMPLSSSINLFQLTNIKNSIFDSKGNLIEVSDPTDHSLDAWSIQTKFETPLLNFNNDLNKNNIGTKKLAYTTIGQIVHDVTKLETLGLWSGYGSTPEKNEGIYLNIQEASSSFIDKNSETGSLIQLCGFRADSKKIGTIAGKKTISEAIVMIPYTKIKNHSEKIYDINKAKTIDEILGENNIFEENQRGAGPFYFNVERDIITEQLLLPFDINSKTSVEQIINNIEKNTSIKYTSIIDTLYKMGQYNIPPHLDWVTNKKINPFVMYIFEFKHDLDQQDLVDIWQGLMPKIAKNPQQDSINIKHKLDRDNFFHGLELPEDVQWKIFKVKKKANKNYYKLTDDSKDDSNFRFTFGNEEKIPEYSFNWPYDYFSLVEMVNVEAGFEFSDQEEKTTLTPIAKPNPLAKLLNRNIKRIVNPNRRNIVRNNTSQIVKNIKPIINNSSPITQKIVTAVQPPRQNPLTSIISSITKLPKK